MNSSHTRLLKEARSLVWPWCALTSIGAAGLLVPSGGTPPFLWPVTVLSFWVGVPLLATLSLGNEFQYRTLSQLLTQPVERARIWSEKSIVTWVAVAATGLMYWFGWRAVFKDPLELSVIAVVCIVSVASAPFWTLVARSTIGGATLNLFQLAAIAFIVNLITWYGSSAPIPIATIVIGNAVGVGYALLMLWLGRRRFERFQPTGTTAEDDLLMERPSISQSFPLRWLRCRPSRPTLNLVRKEVRLLLPVWFVTVGTLLFLAACGLLAFLIPVGSFGSMTASAVCFIAIVLSAILSGSLLIGEERTSGTHAWHLTMPVSIRRQWFLKLLVAVLTSLISAAIPIGVLQVLFGRDLITILSQQLNRSESPMIAAVLGSLILTLFAFWCGSIIKGTLRAALWVFPSICVMAWFSWFASILASPLGVLRASRFVNAAISRFHPYPFANTTEMFIFQTANVRLGVFLLLITVVPIALLQSYRHFRREARDSSLPLFRCLAPVSAAVFVCGFVQLLPITFVYAVSTQTWSVLDETSKAVDRLQLDITQNTAASPRELSLEDLSKTAVLSGFTERWLAGARITVTPRAITRYVPTNGRVVLRTYSYFTTVHLKNDWNCSVYGTDSIVVSCASPHGKWGFPDFP